MLPRNLPDLQEVFQERLIDFSTGAFFDAGVWEVRCQWMTQDNDGNDVPKIVRERHEKLEDAVENAYRSVQRA